MRNRGKLARMLIRHRQALLWPLAAALAFCVGHRFCHRTADFIVYYQGAKSLLAGRTDLYSNTFAWGPPMTYVYPPLFLLLIFPLKWLSFANAFGVWFALLGLATAVVVRRAYHQWRPRHRARYIWLILALAGPFVVVALKSGNVHLLIVLLVVYAAMAWSAGRVWPASFAVALAGAIKIFPLFLLPVFVARREWALVTRVIGLSCLLWLLPIVYFGPQRTASLYRSWSNLVVFHLSEFENKRSLDHSLTGTLNRWFTHIDYSGRLDGDYSQANIATLSRRALKAVTYGVEGVILALSLWMCALLQPVAEAPPTEHDRQLRVASAGVIFITFQLLLGPYAPMLYLCGWLLVALVLPSVVEDTNYVFNLLLLTGTTNLVLFLVPGRNNQRTLQAYGAFALLGLVLWVLSMWSGCLLVRKTRETTPSYSSALDSYSEAEEELASISSALGRPDALLNRTAQSEKELAAWNLSAKRISPGVQTRKNSLPQQLYYFWFPYWRQRRMLAMYTTPKAMGSLPRRGT